MMVIIGLLMLLVPGLISVRILWHDRQIEKKDYKYIISDYLTYSFLIILFAYGFMFITYAERTVSFSTSIPAISHILAASFVFKYSIVAIISAVGLPIGIPWLIKMYNTHKFHFQMNGKSTSTKKLAFYFGSCSLLLALITIITIYARTNGNSHTVIEEPVVYVTPEIGAVYVEELNTVNYDTYAEEAVKPELEPEIVFAGLVRSLPILNTPFYDNYFVLSAPPGIHEQPFDLVVSIPSIPDAVIYYTIDGSEPMPNEDRFVTRSNRIIQVAGQLPADGKIGIHDRSGYWRYSILTYHSENWSGALPANEAEILQGTAFRFRGFIDGVPVTEIITATYIVSPNAGVRFVNRPIIAVTAPYEDFLYIYYHACRNDLTTRRRIFNYEYFELEDGTYNLIFSLPGSSSLGGQGSRTNAQRTLNVHLARGQLDGVVTHPVFSDLYELYRFRLWNGGNSFHWDFMRDPFAQTASSGLSVPFADNNLAIKFVNGEFWGFTNMREHTSNRQFVSTRTGIEIDNIAVMDRNVGEDIRSRSDIVADGDEATVLELYAELVEFVMYNDMTSDYARERLFVEFFCQYNFMDYLISNTFFNNADWPHNNMRFFRAITPDLTSHNPYNDGRWRFILHDMDMAPNPDAPRYNESRFSTLYELSPRVREWELWLNYAFLVFNNPVFVEQFVDRANYVLENHFRHDQLLALHDEFTLRYMPLLPEMYNRFAVRGSRNSSIANFHICWLQLRRFVTNREYYYRKQLDALFKRVM